MWGCTKDVYIAIEQCCQRNGFSISTVFLSTPHSLFQKGENSPDHVSVKGGGRSPLHGEI